MNGPEVNIEKILSETLRATPEHEMDAAGARVLQRLRAEAAVKTGVMGIYAFDFSFLVPIPPPTGGEGGPRSGGGGGGDPETAPWFIAMQEALQDQLGLRVEYATVPAEFVIIHHVEKPSEN